jgi:predicted transcriptional regulator of viral defense system
MENIEHNQEPIYYDTLMLLDKYKDYASPESKISYLVKTGKLTRIRRGLYVYNGDRRVYQYCLANLICTPSYISFAAALRYYDFIPEQVFNITSASYGKNKTKIFATPMGNYIYYCVNPSTYAYGINRIKEFNQSFLIATPEKALLDTLSKIPGVRSIKAFEELLFDDLRLDIQNVRLLKKNKLKQYAQSYTQKNIKMLLKWFKKVTS